MKIKQPYLRPKHLKFVQNIVFLEILRNDAILHIKTVIHNMWRVANGLDNTVLDGSNFWEIDRTSLSFKVHTVSDVRIQVNKFFVIEFDFDACD
jgi:hypothetical protein